MIRVTGFTVVDKLTILGLEISKNFDLEQINLNKLINKIQGMTSQIQIVNGRTH